MKKDLAFSSFSLNRLPIWLQMLLRCSPLAALLALVASAGYFPYTRAAATPIDAIDGSTTYAGSCEDSVCSWLGECSMKTFEILLLCDG